MNNNDETAKANAIGTAIREEAERVDAPERLRAAVAEREVHAKRQRRTFGFVAGTAGAAAALLIVLVVAMGGFGDNAGAPTPSVHDEAVRLALTRAPGPPPERAAYNRRVLRVAVGGVSFPSYAHGTEWDVLGNRLDNIDGRDAATVDYGDDNTRVGYTIVDGPFAGPPADARWVRRNGVDLAITERDGATIVTWERRGRTCVLASRDASVEELVEFASWNWT